MILERLFAWGEVQLPEVSESLNPPASVEEIEFTENYMAGALLTTDAIASVLRREIRKINPGLKVTVEEMVQGAGVKREVIDSESGLDAKKQVAKFYRGQNRAKTKKPKSANEGDAVSIGAGAADEKTI